MDATQEKAELIRLAGALSELRDSLVCMSLFLKDQMLVEQPSAERDEILLQVHRHLARLKDMGRGPLG